MLNRNDREILRALAAEVGEIAALPVQAEKRALWRKLNALRPERPMVMIDQVCWNEMNANDELTLRCTDAECLDYETKLRRLLYQWHHFPVDMVVEPSIKIPKAVENSGFGIATEEETAATDPQNAVVSHHYRNQFETEEDLEKIRMPVIRHDSRETGRRLETAHEIFDGLLEVIPWGVEPYLSYWDPIATWMGAENALLALMDRPEFMHRLLKQMQTGYLSMLDQLEEQGVLCGPQEIIHCTGGYTDELPGPDYDPGKPRTRNIWMFGLAQMLGMVSPDMYREFEIDYTLPLCERFGMVYYGCCDPLDDRIAEVRMLPHVRKISMSPWAKQERGAEEISGDFVFSRKPNPAFVAVDSLDRDLVRNDLLTTRNLCRKNGCPLEFILKDISTVRHHPEHLSEWAKIAMEVAQEP